MSKHIPIRTCVVTREKLAKNEMLRFVFDKSQHQIILDTTGKANGRGVNIKKDLNIVERAFKANTFSRIFKTSFTEDQLKNLHEEITRYLTRESLKKGDEVVVRVESNKIKI